MVVKPIKREHLKIRKANENDTRHYHEWKNKKVIDDRKE